MILDDQRPLVPKWAREVFAYDHGKALQYVSGVGVHWYADDAGLAFALDQFNDEFPEKFILYTEACNGDRPWDTEKVMLGDWNRGEKYLSDIIENMKSELRLLNGVQKKFIDKQSEIYEDCFIKSTDRLTCKHN